MSRLAFLQARRWSGCGEVASDCCYVSAVEVKVRRNRQLSTPSVRLWRAEMHRRQSSAIMRFSGQKPMKPEPFISILIDVFSCRMLRSTSQTRVYRINRCSVENGIAWLPMNASLPSYLGYSIINDGTPGSYLARQRKYICTDLQEV
jgi:hypothetical protein